MKPIIRSGGLYSSIICIAQKFGIKIDSASVNRLCKRIQTHVAEASWLPFFNNVDAKTDYVEKPII